MKADKAKEVLGFYHGNKSKIEANAESEVKASYLVEFIERSLDLPNEKERKIMRWLGFAQGALWAMGVYDVEELKSHNKPEGREHE